MRCAVPRDRRAADRLPRPVRRRPGRDAAPRRAHGCRGVRPRRGAARPRGARLQHHLRRRDGRRRPLRAAAQHQLDQHAGRGAGPAGLAARPRRAHRRAGARAADDDRRRVVRSRAVRPARAPAARHRRALARRPGRRRAGRGAGPCARARDGAAARAGRLVGTARGRHDAGVRRAAVRRPRPPLHRAGSGRRGTRGRRPGTRAVGRGLRAGAGRRAGPRAARRPARRQPEVARRQARGLRLRRLRVRHPGARPRDLGVLPARRRPGARAGDACGLRRGAPVAGDRRGRPRGAGRGPPAAAVERPAGHHDRRDARRGRPGTWSRRSSGCGTGSTPGRSRGRCRRDPALHGRPARAARRAASRLCRVTCPGSAVRARPHRGRRAAARPPGLRLGDPLAVRRIARLVARPSGAGPRTSGGSPPSSTRWADGTRCVPCTSGSCR